MCQHSFVAAQEPELDLAPQILAGHVHVGWLVGQLAGQWEPGWLEPLCTYFLFLLWENLGWCRWNGQGSKKVKDNMPSILRSRLGRYTATFYWSKQITRPAWIQGRGRVFISLVTQDHKHLCTLLYTCNIILCSCSFINLAVGQRKSPGGKYCPLSSGNVPRPQRMPETTDTIQLCFFLCTQIYDKVKRRKWAQWEIANNHW